MGHNAFSRSLTAGVALAGAGALIAATVPEQHDVVEPAPRMVAASVLPTANYVELLATAAVETLQASATALTTDAPALWDTVSVDWADSGLTGRNYARVADMLVLPVVPLVNGPLRGAVTDIAKEQLPDAAERIDELFETVDYLAVRAVGPLVSAIGGAGEAHAGIFRPMTSWDFPSFFEAVGKAPVYVVDGLLHGGYGDIGPLQGTDRWVAPPGLLTPWGADVSPRTIDGPVEDALAKPRKLASADKAALAGDTVEAKPTKPRRGLFGERVSSVRPATDKAESKAPRDRIRESVNNIRNSIREGIRGISARAPERSATAKDTSAAAKDTSRAAKSTTE